MTDSPAEDPRIMVVVIQMQDWYGGAPERHEIEQFLAAIDAATPLSMLTTRMARHDR